MFPLAVILGVAAFGNDRRGAMALAKLVCFMPVVAERSAGRHRGLPG
jgi:hypothetical protein